MTQGWNDDRGAADYYTKGADETAAEHAPKLEIAHGAEVCRRSAEGALRQDHHKHRDWQGLEQAGVFRSAL
jgi:hypothetical protein